MYPVVCDRDTLCFMYPGVFCMYPTCILSRGWNTSEYTQNTLRYTYPPPHTWPDPCASGIHTSVDDAKKSGKKRAKEKEEVVKKEKTDEDEPPAKRKRTPARR